MDPRAFDITSPAGRRVLHNLAQLAHCAAQGKIGSGFDVATAVYGSSVYQRFSPSLVPGVAPGEAGFASLVTKTVGDGVEKDNWDYNIHPVALPPGVAIRMVDVDCGTQTVGMVKKVHDWRDAHPHDAAGVYGSLQACVERLAEVLRGGKTDEIGGAMRPVRELMRRMGQDSGAPIEPESQTAMLDALEKVAGVYGTVVPGAGGYDAAAVVMRDNKETEQKVKEFLEGWSKEHGIRVSLMAVRGETEGVRKEDVNQFRSWLH
jgi:phosphomevalonate kinase